MSTCTGLAALDHANTKFSRGYATTGVGLGVCAHHKFIQKNGAVDLQKGERYANMDYAYASIPPTSRPEAHEGLPSLVRCDLSKQDVRFVIPKLHIYGHQLLCQLKFSLNWLRGAGRTDGEGIERPWAHLSPIATSTRDMGPDEFTAGRGSITESWERMIRNWEEQQEKPEGEREEVANPYEMPHSGMSEAEVRLRLTEEEAAQAKEGNFSLHNVGPTAFMTQLLELEEQQRALKMGVEAKSFETATQKTQLAEKRTKIMRLIGKIRSVQAVYMPGALRVLQQHEGPTKDEHAEEVPLILPSDIPSHIRLSVCHTGLPRLEEELREAQLRGSLMSLRTHLHMKSRLLTYRTTNVKAQGM
ncbi:hypothetical protein BT96DRAFT_1009261, partial [Gymnopus androsaceus JB14]